MGISRVSNRWLNRLYKSIAILLVVFAVLISALRMWLPYAQNYRVDLQNYINSTYNSNIIIGSLEMDWQHSGPSLVATNVSLLQTDVAEIYIQSFAIELDFWRSLRQRKLVTKDFNLDGVKVLLDKTMLANADVSAQDNSLLDSISELFLSQINRFSISNSQVIIRNVQGERTFLVSQLSWLNQDTLHKAKGNIILDGLTSNNLMIQLELKGEQISDMQGMLYLKANQLNITPWLDKVLAIDDENTHSKINFNAWLSIEHGVAQYLQLDFGQSEISWLYQEQQQTFIINKGQLVLDNLADREKIQAYSSPIHVVSNDKVWQPFTFELQQNNQIFTSYLSNIELVGLIDLMPLFIEDENSLAFIKQLSPIGIMSDVFIRNEHNALSGVGQFSELNTQFSHGIPSISNVSGEVIFNQQQANISFSANDGVLDFDKHFLKPIPYKSISAAINTRFDEKGWRLTAEQVRFNSDELNLTAELNVDAQNHQTPIMSLLATASEGDAEFAQRFYPHLLMGKSLVDYLNSSLLKGKLSQAVVLLNGPVDKFPFNENEGIFVVDAELSDATFKFDSRWPAINNFNANLNFTNNSMMITGRSGSLSGIDVQGVQVGIEELTGTSILNVDANFSDTAPELVTNLMNLSPLADSVGATLEQIVINDDISGNFQLALPLKNTAEVIAKGQVYFKDNAVSLNTPKMEFSQVNGTLSYQNDVISVEDISLNWRGLPLTLSVNTKDGLSAYQTDIELKASWQESQWLVQLPELLKPYGEGSLDWQGHLGLKMHHNGEFSYQLDIQSDLEKSQLNLPAPFDKKLNDKKRLNVYVTGRDEQSVINAQLAGQLNFYGVLQHQQVSFSQAHLLLGEEEMFLPTSGFYITTDLAQAKLSEWQPFVLDIIDSIKVEAPTESGTIPLLSQPERIRGKIAQLDVLGEKIHDVAFELYDVKNWWLLTANAKEARGEVKFFPDWHQQGVDISADFIHIPSKERASDTVPQLQAEDVELQDVVTANLKGEITPLSTDFSQNNALFSAVPPVRFRCDDCQFGRVDLGKLSFDLVRTEPTVLQLNNFVAQRKKNKLRVEGTWLHNENQSLTTFVGDYSSKDIEQEIERLGYPSSIKDSGLKADFSINWQGGPQDFDFASLGGDFSGELNEGYLAEVPDKARAFSLLSLQSLVRKLKFDFRDMFSDGMFYDEIKGDFHIDKGIVYTKNTFMKGAAGDLSVKGNTNLNTESLDYLMSYKPNVTSSLPALAWLATLNPVTFLAGIALDEVITSQVVSEIKFEITGNLLEPSVREVDRKTQNISVGRSTPPQIVENIIENTNKKAPEKILQNKPIEPKLPNKPDKTDG